MRSWTLIKTGKPPSRRSSLKAASHAPQAPERRARADGPAGLLSLAPPDAFGAKERGMLAAAALRRQRQVCCLPATKIPPGGANATPDVNAWSSKGRIHTTATVTAGETDGHNCFFFFPNFASLKVTTLELPVECAELTGQGVADDVRPKCESVPAVPGSPTRLSRATFTRIA